jgi:hypothetical protein
MHCIAEQLPVRNVVLMFAMAAGTWVLISIAAAGLWPHHSRKTEIALLENSRDGQPPVSLQGFPHLKSRSPMRTTIKKGKRRFPPLVARIFSPKTSVN